MTTAEKLNTVYDAFNGIKDAIIEKGGTAGSSITEYPLNILDLPSGGDDDTFKNILFRIGLSELKIPDYMTNLEASTFYLNRTITSLDLNNVTSIGNYCFCQNAKLMSVNFSSVQSIGISCFHGTALKNVILPDTLTTIGEGAFLYSTILVIKLPNFLEEIPDSFIRNSPNLLYVNVPDSVITIGAFAFSVCSNILYFNFGNTRTTIPTLKSTYIFSGTNTYKIIVPDSLYDDWREATNWSSTSIQPRIIKYSDALSQGIITE